MSCTKATKQYEKWLAKQLTLNSADLEFKHTQMSADIFSFMRSTFYRWVELFPKHCPELANSTRLLAVGDLHVENFGTWRDIEGRLVWGINDFDEAFELPFTNDLVRLAVSAHIAIDCDHLAIRPADACKAILEGYTEQIGRGGEPFVLEDKHHWLRSAVSTEPRDPIHFWDKLTSLPPISILLPKSLLKVVQQSFPGEVSEARVAHRVAGLGSLGRERFVVIANYRGGLLAREGKPLISSACSRGIGSRKSAPLYETVISRAIRCPDPYLAVRRGWVVRRLAPDCSRIRLNMLTKGRDEYKLLTSMGSETANIHLGSGRAIQRVIQDLKHKPEDWLHVAARSMVKATAEDWQSWKDQT